VADGDVSDWNTLAIVATCVAGLAALLLLVRRRPRRTRDTLGPFLRHFDARGVPPEVASTLHHHLQRWMSDGGRSFPVRPGDDLAAVHGIEPEDVGATVDLLLAECGRRRDGGVEGERIETVEDLILFVASCPPERGP
jgi:hypothetical protein